MTLEELEKTLAAMTPGPWALRMERGACNLVNPRPRPDGREFARVLVGSDLMPTDSRGIATLRNIAADLIAVARAAEREAVCTCADRGWAAYPRRHAPDCPAHLCGETRDALDALDAALARLAPPEPED